MKKILYCILFCCCFLQTFAQTTQKPYQGKFYNKDYGIYLNLDLYKESIEIPGYSFFGKVNGYIDGKIHSTWILVSYKIHEDHAHIRLSNDQGAESQSIIISCPNDSILNYRAIDGNHIKRVQKGKFVKIPQELIFNRIN